jgi:hypothetical protein
MIGFNNIRKAVTATAAAAVIGLGAMSAQAATINNFLVGGLNTLEDTNFDRILRPNAVNGDNGVGGFTVVTSGDFQVGDILQAVLRFEQINISNAASFAPYELFAYSELEVKAITATQIFPGIFANTLTFGATGNLGQDVLVSVYEDNTPLATYSTADPDTTIANILAKDAVATFGLIDADDYWFAQVGLGFGAPSANSITDLATLGNGGQAFPIAPTGNFGLSIITNTAGIPILEEQMVGLNGVSKHDVVGAVSGKVRQPGANTGWLIQTDTTLSFRVPEPDSLALIGVVLIGVAAVSRRKAK